jgi:hypothetical protein
MCFIGCGEDGIFDVDWNETPPEKPSGLSALEFPTKNGSAWEYVDAQGNTHILRIDGIKSINGVTYRILENTAKNSSTSEGEGTESDSSIAIADFYAANALYIKINGAFVQQPFPISATYFIKTKDAYIEGAFDAYIEFLEDPTWHQKHFPTRKIWQFPLQVGTEWIVLQSGFPEITTTRKVVADKVEVTVPAGTYNNAYLIEEHAFINGGQPLLEKPNRYWVAPDVGVVKYEFTDFTSTPGDVKVYELNKH